MHLNLTRLSTAKFLIALSFIGICFGASTVAQSVVSDTDLPLGCSFSIDNRPSWYVDKYTNRMVAVNPITNRTYAAINCNHDLADHRASLLEINGNDNSQRLIELRLSDEVRLTYNHFDTVMGIAVDPTRNRVYIAATEGGVFRDVVLMFDANTNTTEVFKVPAAPPTGWDLLVGDLAVNPTSGNVYLPYLDYPIAVLSGQDKRWLDIISPAVDADVSGEFISLAIDATRNLLYLTDISGNNGYPAIRVINLNNNNYIAKIPIPQDFAMTGAIAINTVTNRIYLTGLTDQTCSILVVNATDYGLATVTVPGYEGQTDFNCQFFGGLTVNPKTNRIYMMPVFGSLTLITLDGGTNAITAKTLNENNFLEQHGLAINPETNLLYVPKGNTMTYGMLTIAAFSSGDIPTGSSSVQADFVNFNFANVTNPGTLSVTPIADPAVAGDLPGGFAISDQVAFEITPDANLHFTGSVTSCFKVPTVDVQNDFNALAVLHREETSPGIFSLVDRTSAHDFPTRTICATTTSFSPFYIALRSNKIKTLFDRTKAFKSGSTIPVKIELDNLLGQNISAQNTVLTMRGLKLIGSNSTSGVVDSGNANPDNNFRYVAGNSGSYIFNFSTKGLSPGKYVLSFYAGSDHSFFYTVEFEVR